MSKRRTKVTFPAVPLTERERVILDTLYAYDGVLGFSHIQRLLAVSGSQVYRVMKRLLELDLINQPSPEQRKWSDQPVYWLSPTGAAWIAHTIGLAVSELSYRDEPRWMLLHHDFAVSDFRLDVAEACASHERLMLESWYPERYFREAPDTVSFTSAQKEQKQRIIIPDGYCTIRVLYEKQYKLKRYFVEIDRGTEDNVRIVNQKILPYLAYLKSDAHEQRFGIKGVGLILTITTGLLRVQNMLNNARRYKANRFLYTTFDQVTPETVLTHPIWYFIGQDDPVPLIDFT